MDNLTIVTNTTPDAIALHTKITLYSVLLVWSLLGNVLIIAVVLCGNQQLKTNFNFLIVNMAISDLLIPLLALPLTIFDVMSSEWLLDGPLGSALCKLSHFFTDISPVVSALSLVIIAAERFVIIGFPMKKTFFTNKRISLLIAFTWITAMALFSPYFYIFRLVNEKGLNRCLPDFDGNPARAIFSCSVAVISFVIPSAAIILIYTAMLYKLGKVSRKAARMLNNEQMLSRQRRDKKIFYMSIAIIVVFVVLWGPFFCFLLALNFVWHWNFGEEVRMVQLVLFFVQYLGYLNSAVNPCIYFVFLDSYRRGVCNLFRKYGKATYLYKTGRRSTGLSSKEDVLCETEVTIPLKRRRSLEQKESTDREESGEYRKRSRKRKDVESNDL